MDKCYICPRKCGADRTRTVGYCGCDNNVRIARSGLHFWEEPPISGTNGAGTVFFTGCSLRCIYCQNHEISTGENRGRELSPRELSDVFFELIEKGAHNIDLVTPSQFAPQIAEALRLRKPTVPVVYNSSGYEDIETLKSLEGLVDVYLPDYKYAEAELAGQLSAAPDYPELVIPALSEMYRQCGECVYDEKGIMQKGMIIRHLILPLHTKNSIAVLRSIKEHFSGVPLSLMAQYTPIGEFPEHPELERGITKRELLKVQDEMFALGLEGFVQELSAKGKKYIPDFSEERM